MTDSTQTTPPASGGSSGKAEEQRYEVPELIEASRALLGVKGDVAAGALSASDRKTHTIAQAQKLVKEHQTHVVEIQGMPTTAEEAED